MPKSTTLVWPDSVIMMLSGLRSRWTMPWLCAKASAFTTGTMSSTARGAGSGFPSGATLVSVCPVRNSNTMKGMPCQASTSKMMTMFSCWQAAVVRASRMKRLVRSGECVRRNLMATRRPRRVSRARYTEPMPPRPRRRITS